MTGLIKPVRYTILFLVIFTCIVYGWFMLGGAKKEYIVSPVNSTYKIIDDKGQNGATESSLYIDRNGALLECDIVNKAQWPFCEIAISLTDSVDKGIDLSDYDSVGIDIDYDSPLEGERVRIYLRNYDSAYAKLSDPISLKFNAIEYAPGEDKGLVVFPLRSFQVLSWWIADYEVPVDKSSRQFDNISIIEVATGSYVKEANYSIRLNKLVFYGERITEQALVKILLSLWVVTAISFIIIDRIYLRKKIKETEERTQRLRAANRTLYEKSLVFEELAFTDPLTRTRNRHEINEWLAEVTTHSIVNNISFSMIFIDIDYFKQVNDKYGHRLGDEVLRRFASLINKRVRKSDVFARWGGEEFVIFCPATPLGATAELAESIRECIESAVWDNGMKVTCSLGVAELENEDYSHFIERADEALMKAKERGRNRVEIAWNERQL
ncbi:MULTISPECIES: GGDEF domain-containing protein [unclassified Photobacterium]|uniref:GGDEF domain-containing protein n=1 Tax=unclassified Photobacterium TaxID=2628852 RepID=UPI000D17533D|nr:MULTISPECIES: GGDEF domain-containing protein [unclassified Photobacterium]PSV27566.1 GGDEF domain-containing protein [Photobacterium sp. GB-56]PSV28585.1 GGDEF domain-containing protein [Photobacterium sp. GB-72]PSV34593.1 GGDEF domain-containing protein [Photobacterium sp. GB-210]PSV37238.1 GGDEF domain-containing protein [Photobacterium sp. GB-27]PSV44567.1 GGDEF domain-containing protein [Photobacterium sp. GB-36]